MRHFILVIVVAVGVIVYAAPAFASQAGAPALGVASPSSLHDSCEIERRWLGIHPRMDYGVWLRCGGADFLITGPLSLFGHVTIQDEGSALEFVRFFSLAAQDAYVRPDGMVEVLPASAADDGFNTVRPEVFRKLLHPPVVKKLSRGSTERVTMFSVQRVMLTPAGKVVDVTEIVGENGYYDIVSRRVVVRDASRIGLFYLPH